MIYVIGYGGGIEILTRLAFVTAIIGLVLYNFGKKIFLHLAFPLLFLYFMIPFPIAIENLVSLRLQLWMTQISSAILNTLTIPVLREGNLLHFANCSLEVAEACSGIRSLTAYIMLGCLFGYMMRGSYWKRFLMVLIAVPLAFLVNIIRVVGTGALANYFGEGIAKGFLHEFSGIVVFLLGLFIFFIIFQFLDQKNSSQTQEPR
jgi:exosortase